MSDTATGFCILAASRSICCMIKWNISRCCSLDQLICLVNSIRNLTFYHTLTIKTVHCWTNRSALGTADGGLTINIETPGKNRVLRSLRSGQEAETSDRLLRELVEAMGYGARLPQKES